MTAVSPAVEAAARAMARRLELRRAVAVLESAAVSVPTLVGWVQPVVLLPAAALSGLSPQQLEAILAHELAHIRRHDYLVNLLQSVVETLLFYHPAVWWVSAEVRAEREHCCDDLAVAVCGDRLVYVSALAELTSIERRAFALAATDGSLVGARAAHSRPPVERRRELPPSWGILALLVLIGGGAGTYRDDAADASRGRTQVLAAAASTAAPPSRRVRRPTSQAVPAVRPAPAGSRNCGRTDCTDVAPAARRPCRASPGDASARPGGAAGCRRSRAGNPGARRSRVGLAPLPPVAPACPGAPVCPSPCRQHPSQPPPAPVPAPPAPHATGTCRPPRLRRHRRRPPPAELAARPRARATSPGTTTASV